MDDLIRGAVERVTGESAHAFDWSESLTTAEEIAGELEGKDGRPGVDLIFVTDHVNETVRELDPGLVALASSEPRVALGAEVQTVLESPLGSGEYLEAPEVLMYGSPEKVRSPGGTHYGVSAEILDDIQATCRPGGARRIELHRVLAYCRENRIAHAISHPLDGHFVELPQVLRAISSCRFIEAVNGGYGSDSTRRLLRYIEIHNAARDRSATPQAGAIVEPPNDDAAAITEWLALRLLAANEHVSDGIVPWGGSDAHLGRYDRVCMMYRPPASASTPGIPEMVRDMIETPAHELLADRVFEIEGRGNSLASVFGEVMQLIVINARRNAKTFSGVRRFTRLLALAPYIAVEEILRGRRAQTRLGTLLDTVLDGSAEALQTKEAVARTKQAAA
ncbi:MAG: hypothetical protein P8R42_01185 [Candidatus Binatia bacterium]|nr:hypothetical protein [Candidatus Binatia bacterium]